MVNGDVGKRLWAAADQLWANTGFKPAEFSAPVLGLIFLRFAEKKYATAEEKLGPIRSGGRRKVSKDDYLAEGVIFLPETARFSYLMTLTDGDNIGKAVNEAMRSIEEKNPDLKGALPRNYTLLENWVLLELLKLIGPVDLSEDAFGKVYEYFLDNFALKEGQKGGGFYTPESIVKLIVEIIEVHRDWQPEQIEFLANIVRLYRSEAVELDQGSESLLTEKGQAQGYADVPGLCKIATRAEIEAQGWSLNPGRYVGAAAREAKEAEVA